MGVTGFKLLVNQKYIVIIIGNNWNLGSSWRECMVYSSVFKWWCWPWWHLKISRYHKYFQGLNGELRQVWLEMWTFFHPDICPDNSLTRWNLTTMANPKLPWVGMVSTGPGCQFLASDQVGRTPHSQPQLSFKATKMNPRNKPKSAPWPDYISQGQWPRNFKPQRTWWYFSVDLNTPKDPSGALKGL